MSTDGRLSGRVTTPLLSATFPLHLPPPSVILNVRGFRPAHRASARVRRGGTSEAQNDHLGSESTTRPPGKRRTALTRHYGFLALTSRVQNRPTVFHFSDGRRPC